MKGRSLIWIAVAAVMAWVAWSRYTTIQQRRAEKQANAMQYALIELRGEIRRFRETHGRHPYSLDELPSIPADPVTGSKDTWRVMTEETVQPSDDFTGTGRQQAQSVIIDVRSGAPGTDHSGRAWSDY